LGVLGAVHVLNQDLYPLPAPIAASTGAAAATVAEEAVPAPVE
jgi:hypothetical protein